TSYCIPTLPVAAAHFASTIQPRGRGNGCPDLLSFDRLNANGAVTTARGQMDYERLVPGTGGTPTPVSFASVSNLNTVDVQFKTVLDGISVGRLRSNAGYFGAGCDDLTAAYARVDDVHDWFGAASSCDIKFIGADVPIDGGPPPPAFRHALGNAYPNPLNPTTRIQFTNGEANGRVQLEIFDVTGRLIRRLVDAKLPAGVHDITWDGADDGGSTVPSGMYFYRMTAEGFVSARKLVVSK
ncbi:MAG: FG-GAP repeat protein, partial [bacterium]